MMFFSRTLVAIVVTLGLLVGPEHGFFATADLTHHWTEVKTAGSGGACRNPGVPDQRVRKSSLSACQDYCIYLGHCEAIEWRVDGRNNNCEIFASRAPTRVETWNKYKCYRYDGFTYNGSF